jgi:hypothetical protein
MTELTKAGTIDDPAATEVTAAHYTSQPDKQGDIPSLVVTIDLGDILGAGWTYDSVLSFGEETGTDITLLFYPQGSDEGWQRLDEVGEW